jgi:hypothetical protein
MTVHALECEQWVPCSPGTTFELFSDAFALERITPPWLSFRVLSSRPIEMRARANHVRAEAPRPAPQMADADRSLGSTLPIRRRAAAGPLPAVGSLAHIRAPKRWTVIVDRVRYQLPLGVLGELARMTIVRRDLERIFDYRQGAVARALGVPGKRDS